MAFQKLNPHLSKMQFMTVVLNCFTFVVHRLEYYMFAVNIAARNRKNSFSPLPALLDCASSSCQNVVGPFGCSNIPFSLEVKI